MLYLCAAHAADLNISAFTVKTNPDGTSDYSVSLQVVVLMTLLSFLPSILIMMTSFTRIVIVLAILRQAMGLQTSPSNQVIIGISLSRVPIKEALGDWRAYAVSLTRLILCPVAAWLVMGLFLPQDGTILGVYTVTAACPSAAMITILSIRFGADDSFASKINFLSTVLSAVTLPLVTYFLL